MATPSLAMIPSGYKDGKLYSVLPANGDGDFTFSRGSSATRVNKDGLIETVTGDTPRPDYTDSSCPSLLLEPQGTNLITYSQDFSNSIWANTSAAISVNLTSSTSPDGTLTGNEFNEGTLDGRRAIYEDLSVTANQSHTLSVFVKKGTSNYFRLVIAQNGVGLDWTAVQVDLSDNSLSTKNGSSSSFTDVSSSISDTDYNGYYRLTLTAKHPTATSLRLLFCTSNGAATASSNSYGRPDYVGTSKTVYAWGSQIEQQSYATSYIPTNGAIATRLADSLNCSLPDTNSFNSSNGFSVISKFGIGAAGGGTSSTFMSFNDDSTTTYIGFGSTVSAFRCRLNLNGTAYLNTQGNALRTQENSLFTSCDVNGWSQGANGVTNDTGNNDASVYDKISNISITTNDSFGIIKVREILIYNTALTDEELEELTK